MSQMVALALVLLTQSPDAHLAQWKRKADSAVREAKGGQTVRQYADAFEAAWKADDWRAAVDLAEQAEKRHAGNAKLRGLVARAYWRAGRIRDAQRVVERIPADTRDRVGLSMLIGMALAEGRGDTLAPLVERLEALDTVQAEDLALVVGAKLARNELKGVADLIRQTLDRSDPRNGFPEVYFEENLGGVAEFLDAIGPEPINQVTRYGEAAMPPHRMLNLPYVDVFINGKGPYRMIADTGGSVMLSVDRKVAREVGLPVHASAKIRGVGGVDDSEQSLVDELTIGGIRCRRVMTRVFDASAALLHQADGILGTGVFMGARMTMDFANAKLIVTESGESQAVGVAAPVWLVGDAKLITLVEIEGKPAAGLLDSGADAVALTPSRLRALFPEYSIQVYNVMAMGVGTGENAGLALAPGTDVRFADKTYRKISGLGLDVLDKMLSPMLGIQNDILIGMPFFRDMQTFTIDYPRAKMWVQWLK